MALSSLFRRNAELCTEMASSTKSAEVREQWIALAGHWRQKAEADQPLARMPISPEPLAPSLELEGPCAGEEPAQVPTLAPTLVPSEPQLLTVEGRSQVPIENVGDGSALEDVWSQVIADIRTQIRR